MTGKIRMMSAGMGGASRYRVNPWGNQGGGNKKQGLPPTTNKPVQYVLASICALALNPVKRPKNAIRVIFLIMCEIFNWLGEQVNFLHNNSKQN